MSMYDYIEEGGEIVAIPNPEKQKELRQKKYQYFLEKSNLPQFYWDIDFKDYKGRRDSEAFKRALYYAENIDKKQFKHVSLFIHGVHSTQKCVTGDTLVLTENGFQYIKDFSSNINGFHGKEVKLLSKEGFNCSSHFFEEKTNKTIKIELQNGMIIEGTPEHPLYILNSDLTYSFKSLQDITDNDFIIVKKDTFIFNKIPFKINFNYVKNKRDFISKDLKNIPDYLDSRLSRFLGYYIANGNKDANSLTVSTKNEKIRKDLKEIINSFGLNLSTSPIDTIYNGIHSAQFKDLIYSLLAIDNSFNFTARYKFVPNCILQGTKENQIDFLRSLIDCDSYYNDKQNRLGYFTASEKLAREVQLLLLNLGVYSNLYKDFDKKYQHNYWELWITGEEVEKYFNLIQYSLKYSFNFKRFTYKLNYSIPYLANYTTIKMNQLRGILKVNRGGYFLYNGEKKKFPLRYLNQKIKVVQNITKEVLYYSYEQLLDAKQYNQENIINDLIEKYKQFIDNNSLVYVKVKNKQIINNDTTVYDFTIPEVHNFYSNGMISHNTAIACNILKEAIRKGLKCKFILAGSLIDKLMKLQGFNKDEELYDEIKELKQSDVILIDDCWDIDKNITWKNNNSLIITEWDIFLRDLLSRDTKIIMTSNFDKSIIKTHFGESLFQLIDRNFAELHFTESIKEIRKLTVESAFDSMDRRTSI
jgi:intein/homing endonuclease